MNFPSLTKADVLVFLSETLKSARIEDIYIVNVGAFQRNPSEIIDKIQERFQLGYLILRSSVLGEDSVNSSFAGCFHSEAEIDRSDRKAILKGLEAVVQSYKKIKPDVSSEQILIQPFIEQVKMSGVVLTRELESNAYYYVINFDDESDNTSTVTSGKKTKTIYISHLVTPPYEQKWAGLLQAIQEIETIFPEVPLDIEFAVKWDGSVIIFQVRPLAANKNAINHDRGVVCELIQDMQNKFKRYSKRAPHIAGERTIFGDMPDWNPAEIIGNRPNTLDYTLYRFVITDKVWHEARHSLGYSDVYPGELITSFGKKPYVDVRFSFNNLTPHNIPKPLREKLINYYLRELERSPEKQDKVEFEILWTCYSFTLDRELKVLLENGFNEKEVACFRDELWRLTDNILQDSPSVFESDLESNGILAERHMATAEALDEKLASPWELLTAAYYVLQNCKKYGTFPFSRLARLAFIAKTLLVSLKEAGIISSEFQDSFLGTVKTVATALTEDLAQFHAGRISKDCLIQRYGHLRLGTYDITAPRYVDLLGLIDRQEVKSGSIEERPPFQLEENDRRKITVAMRKHNISGDADFLLDFIRKAIVNRELSKFEFTKSLSYAIELIAQAGDRLGFSREELCHVDLHTLMKFRNPEISDVQYAKKVIQGSIERHKKEKDLYDGVLLPPVITHENDFIYVKSYESRPNFITNRLIKGTVLKFDKFQSIDKVVIKGKIVIIESADPGYDWIFSQSPLGLITKYGGMASHMAIRCAEFGLPAAIGCGEGLYGRIIGAKYVLMDCHRKMIEIV